MCYLKRKFAEQLADFTGTDRIYIDDTEAYYLDKITAADVKLFLLKQTYKTLNFSGEGAFLPKLPLFLN